MLFYEVRFQNKGLDLVVDHDEFKVCDNSDELLGLRIMVSARLEIRTYPVSQILSLTDVDDLARGILMNINAGRLGQGFELLVDRHTGILSQPFRTHATRPCRIAVFTWKRS